MKSEILCFDRMLLNVRLATSRGGPARRGARADEINALTVKRLRGWTRLSQPEFARLLGVELSTLRNWEQGRREPTGPARALLRAICNDPENVLRALRSAGVRRAVQRREAASRQEPASRRELATRREIAATRREVGAHREIPTRRELATRREIPPRREAPARREVLT